MTDKEIEKGLECCAEFLCGECPYQKFDHIDYKLQCIHMLIVDVANLYKRTVVDAVPVVHGWWVPCGFGKAIKCSACGCELGDVWEYRHCPDCGAIMDG